MSAIVSSAITKSSSSMAPADQALGLLLVRRRDTAPPRRRAAVAHPRSRDALDAAPRQVVDRVGVEVVLDVARQRAAEDDVARDPREVVELVGEHLQLLGPHRRAPLVDLGQRAGGRIDDGDRGARLVGDVDEIAEDSLEAEILDDPVAGAAACETAGDHRGLQPLQRPRDVDALAAGAREAARRPVPVAELEVRDGQRPVDRGIQGYGDDHCRFTTPLRRLLDADRLTDAKGVSGRRRG